VLIGVDVHSFLNNALILFDRVSVCVLCRNLVMKLECNKSFSVSSFSQHKQWSISHWVSVPLTLSAMPARECEGLFVPKLKAFIHLFITIQIKL
jgi:hypothetical protein